MKEPKIENAPHRILHFYPFSRWNIAQIYINILKIQAICMRNEKKIVAEKILKIVFEIKKTFGLSFIYGL